MMGKKPPIYYDDLYRYFANEAGGREASYVDSDGWTTVVDTECGIDLHRPPLCAEQYWCTPANSVRFAHTGGDGCHFSFLLTNGEWSERSPVVLTVPHAGACRHNIIVGASLREFLELGLRSDYFSLEGLATTAEKFDDGHRFVRRLGSRRRAPWVSPEQAAALRQLAKRFELRPWVDVGHRLMQLQRRYLPKLVYSDEYHEIMGP